MALARSRIGITCDYEVITCRRGLLSPRFVTPQTYVRAVSASGATPWLIPHQEAAQAPHVLADLDGLVISGGDFDIPPAAYGQNMRPGCGKLLEVRSTFEMALLRLAMAQDMPILGICGGMQLLNVVTGGSLFQDLTERPDTACHEQPHDRALPQHGVSLRADTKLANIFACDRIEVNSTHHQVVDQVGPGVVVCGTADDGVIEAIELPHQRFSLGVQWHPEAMGGAQDAIYGALTAACRR